MMKLVSQVVVCVQFAGRGHVAHALARGVGLGAGAGDHEKLTLLQAVKIINYRMKNNDNALSGLILLIAL